MMWNSSIRGATKTRALTLLGRSDLFSITQSIEFVINEGTAFNGSGLPETWFP
jgi:hypothetical protein